jgi:cytochrome c biogenesis protein CcmG/thiol:disulfide interchange protein DsbE
MQNIKKHWRSISIAIMLITGSWIAYTSLFIDPPSSTGTLSAPREGFSAPDFSLSTLDGSTIKLSDLTGQVIFINFWATWCPPCEAEMPAIQALTEQHPEVAILAVNATNQDNINLVQNFVQERGLTFQILLDNDGTINRLYKINALPSSFFVDKQGIIRKVVYGGPISESLLIAEISQLEIEP